MPTLEQIAERLANAVVPIYEVPVDAMTGELIGEPTDTGATTKLVDWHLRKGTETERLATYRTERGEVRALICRRIRNLPGNGGLRRQVAPSARHPSKSGS